LILIGQSALFTTKHGYDRFTQRFYHCATPMANTRINNINIK